jgi:hypothetical protein
MNKKCPPGVICVENVTMFFFIIIILVIIYIFYNYMGKQAPISNNHQKIIIKEKNEERNDGNGWGGNGWGLFTRPNYGYTNLPGDVLMNPYMPPLRDERYLVSTGSIPINVSTNIGSVDTNYRQVGILTPLNGTSSNKILPLMGRPLFVNRDKWQYYTMSDQNNSIKLPISRNGRSCTNEYGCDKLYGGDTIYVEGYNQAFKITIYDNDTIKYIPFI